MPEDVTLLSLRFYLIIKAMEGGTDYFTAQEAVNALLAGQKTFDPTLRTFSDWEKIVNNSNGDK
jgi:hypothetical protein